MPDWSADELAEMGPLMQQEIRHGVRVREWAKARLRWDGAREVSWEGGDYEVLIAALASPSRARKSVSGADPREGPTPPQACPRTSFQPEGGLRCSDV